MRAAPLCASIACFLMSVQLVTAQQLTFGACSHIININFKDSSEATKLFGRADPELPERAARLDQLMRCEEYISDPRKRLEVLVFSLHQMILMKERYLLPAMDAFIQDPSSPLNGQALRHYSNLTSGRIDAALEKALALEAQLTVARLRNSTQIVPNTDDAITRALRNLDTKINRRIALDLGLRQQVLNQARQELSLIRSEYQAIINDLKAVAEELGKRM